MAIEDIQLLTLSAPVTTVTLLEDRAQVQRTGKATLTEGLWRITVDRVAPILSDKSLRAEFCDRTTAARVNDVRVRRRLRNREEIQQEVLGQLYEEWRSHRIQFDEYSEDAMQLEEHFAQLSHIVCKAVLEMPIDAVWGQVDPMAWRSQFQTLFQQIRETRMERFQTHQAQKQLWQTLDRLRLRLIEQSRPDTIYTAHLEADLTIPQAGEYELSFDYVVPNALWRPYHQAHMQIEEREIQDNPTEGTPTEISILNFRTDGCVWQNTGEDWTNVDLVFSTARSSLGTEPPLLSDDMLTVQEKPKRIAIQMRDRVIQQAGLGTSAATDNAIELPGVEDGGEVRTLRPASKATVPSDGRPYRIPLFEFSTPTQIEYVLMPEIACQVVLKSEQSNSSNFPILAGPVDLVKSTEFIGKTSVNFIASKEKFALGWGVDAAIRVQRTESQKREENHLTKWITITKNITLYLSNIGDRPKTLATTERVPVSELEHIQVEVLSPSSTDAVQPDANGFCTWQLHLAPYSQRVAGLVYTISASPEVEGF
ncbi:mucoidy inhibitor MuiA family protein [Tumidithrix helvetica PCC 7403]|uniref:mucoidy inhibitor MuiA family protein n=1 Tax=Tumidithrix helvetica TaxID=3457545 RepID=UPI003CAC5125